MDAAFAKIAQETIKFGFGDEEIWRELYEPLYPEFPSDVQLLSDERYGPAERNLLDIYVPPGDGTDRPVIIYMHGGGFYGGDKRWSEKCYANIGYTFASHGIVTVVANHQLVPNVMYPGGAEDIQLVREWVYKNISAARYGCGSPSKVVLFGHSSGGAHIAMNLFAAGDSERAPRDPLFPPVAGLILLDVPFWYDRKKPTRQKTIRSYYGGDEEEIWGPKSALGLWERLPDDSPVLDSEQLPIYIGTVQWEVPETADANIMFFNAYRARSKPTGTLPLFNVLPKHNHLSDVLSIGTSDTAQCDLVLHFVATCLRNKNKKQKEVSRI